MIFKIAPKQGGWLVDKLKKKKKLPVAHWKVNITSGGGQARFVDKGEGTLLTVLNCGYDIYMYVCIYTPIYSFMALNPGKNEALFYLKKSGDGFIQIVRFLQKRHN